MDRAKIAFVLGLLITTGEWITREDTGERVCRVAAPLTSETPMSAGWCDDWQIPKPIKNQPVPSEEHGWIKCESQRCWLHTESGWK